MLSFSDWFKLWMQVRSNYLPDNETPTEAQLKKWYWEEVGSKRKPKKGIGSYA